jgi:transcriptional regulator with XRE-family HTH domain
MDSQVWQGLAHQIRQERKRRKWTQKELADAANVSLGTVQNAEAGKSVPQPSNRVAILGVLGITEEGTRAAPRDGWAPEVRVALNIVGLWLEQVEGEEREERIRRIIFGVLSPE